MTKIIIRRRHAALGDREEYGRKKRKWENSGARRQEPEARSERSEACCLACPILAAGCWLVVLALVLLCLAPLAVRADTPAQVAVAVDDDRAERVDAAMKGAVDALYAAQKNDNWEAVPIRTGEVKSANGGQWTGLTAITTYALLSAGESVKDKRIAAAIDFLVNHPSQGVYASAARCLV